MFHRNHYRILANTLMMMVLTFVLMDLVGLPAIRWYQTSKAIKLAKERLDLLRADMDADEVKATLGLPDYITVGSGSGPEMGCSTWFIIGHSHHLDIERNAASNPPRLISVRVDDKIWKPQDNNTNR